MKYTVSVRLIVPMSCDLKSVLSKVIKQPQIVNTLPDKRTVVCYDFGENYNDINILLQQAAKFALSIKAQTEKILSSGGVADMFCGAFYNGEQPGISVNAETISKKKAKVNFELCFYDNNLKEKI